MRSAEGRKLVGGDVDEQPMVAIEYAARSIQSRVEDLLSLRKAVDGLLETFGVEAIA